MVSGSLKKTEQNMNNQNIDENPYAPPKSAADFRQPEKGTKKQRIARVFLGAMGDTVFHPMEQMRTRHLSHR